MAAKEKYVRHYEESAMINSSMENVFAYADEHTNFSSHINKSSWMRVYIDYDLPNSFRTRWLGQMFGGVYAKWCVQQMVDGTHEQFSTEKRANV